jgi:hypothetical protein
MTTARGYSLGGVILALMLLVMTHDAWAMPAFGRKYQTTCVTCHESFPRSNPVGEAFRMNGYRFIDDEVYIKREPMELGDEAHKRLWPESIWPNTMPQHLPLSLTTIWIAEIDTNPGRDPLTRDRDSNVTFILPHEIEVAWADTVGEKMSIYGDIRFIQEDFASDEIYSWAHLKAWMEFQDLYGPENLLNLRVGSVGMHSLGLFTARDEQGITFQPYLLNAWSMPDLLRGIDGEVVQDSQIKDFEGNTFVVMPQTGIELNGFQKRWLYYAGVVNGKIKNPYYKEPEDDIFFLGAGSNTSAKDYYCGFAYKWGGLGFDGFIPKEDTVEEETEKKLPSEGEFWRDNSVTMSLFGYLGEGEVKITTWDTDQRTIVGPHTIWKGEDDFWRLGVGLLARYQDLTVGAGYMHGNNDNPYGFLSDATVDSNAWFVEAHYFLYPWFIPYARYDGLYFDDLPEDRLLLNGESDREILTVGCKAHIRANVSLRAEGVFYTDDEGYDYGLDNKIFFVLSASF